MPPSCRYRSRPSLIAASYGRKTRRLDGASGIMCFEVQVGNYGG